MSDFIVHHLELNGQGGATALSSLDLPTVVPESGCRWIHLDCLEEEGFTWLSDLEGIPETAVEALFAEETRPRAVKMGDGLLLTLRGVNLNPESNPSDMVSLRLWVTPHFIVSSRRRKLLSVQDTVKNLVNNEGPTNTGDIVATLTETLTGRMAKIIHDLEDELADLEESIGEGIEADQRDSLVQRRLETIRLRRFLVPQKEAINKLAQESLAWMTPDQTSQVHEAANDITRYVEGLESLRERCLLMQEEFANLQAEKMNARMYVLSILSGIFMPLGFLTGLFGINIGGMPGTDNGSAFWLFCIALVVLGGGQFVVMRKSRWF
ncbi:MAG: zinc transporter ZntB [Marinomonas foliarum]|jgi:zinc transporter|uniref:Zinc transporter ZntB n=1 Tax=Marinomonas foliarum TaxID=491950 RepID=A0ABX7ISV8_9GAMM|nr:zinc transporter ZntB [Marinomonas foliarum]QRV25445.1 zinc transporter ZntB [Marinomonas foliarum]